MMVWSELVECINHAAKACRAAKVSAAEIYRQADEQELDGMTVVSPYTRLLASAVQELENEHNS